MHRFYCPDIDLKQKTVFILDPKEIHHLTNVLRLKPDAEIALFNSNREEVRGKILEISKAKVSVKVDAYKKIDVKIPQLILACAIPKKSKFETIIEKSTELGVDEIMPLRTSRTEVHLNEDRHEKKILRYETVAINAAKQSQRISVPHIHPLTEFSKAIEYLLKDSAVIMPSLTGETETIFQALARSKEQGREKISILIGPEGDFSDEEYRLAHAKGCIPVTLGDTILKVETAAICAVSCVRQYFL
jgi:16S rRNA (uracil1498-N3)-methyltransferase